MKYIIMVVLFWLAVRWAKCFVYKSQIRWYINERAEEAGIKGTLLHELLLDFPDEGSIAILHDQIKERNEQKKKNNERTVQ